jgi:DNA-binding NarL/FixJ family response regulator
MTTERLKIVIADNNQFLCEALKDSLQVNKRILVLKTIYNLEELIEYVNKNPSFDVLILDVNFNGKSSLNYIKEFKTTPFKIIALTTHNNSIIKSLAQENGVDLFLGKDTDYSKFEDTILDCYYNRNSSLNKNKPALNLMLENLIFTKRKLEVLQALYKHSNLKEKELAKVLFISESTLKAHKRELFEITNTKSTPELIKFGIQNGLILS